MYSQNHTDSAQIGLHIGTSFLRGACSSNNRHCDGKDFGGHQKAVTRAYWAKMILRGRRGAETGRRTYHLERSAIDGPLAALSDLYSPWSPSVWRLASGAFPVRHSLAITWTPSRLCSIDGLMILSQTNRNAAGAMAAVQL